MEVTQVNNVSRDEKNRSASLKHRPELEVRADSKSSLQRTAKSLSSLKRTFAISPKFI